jgi:RNA polymerase sigma factor (sigma-70 family)
MLTPQQNPALEEHRNLIRHMMRRYRNTPVRGVEEDDLEVEAEIGLWRALTHYQTNRKASFSTFACHLISHELSNRVEAEMRTHRVGDRSSYLAIRYPVSLSAPIDDDDKSSFLPVNPSPSPEQCAFDVELWRIVDELPGNLPAIVRRRYQDGVTLAEIGFEYGLNRVEVFGALRRAHRLLRKRLGEDWVA